MLPAISCGEPTARKNFMNKIPPGKLYNLALEESRKVTLEKFHELTRLPLNWCEKFRQGRIPTPSVQRVECVIVKLTGKAVNV